MQTGTKISAIAHLALVGWAVFGASLEPEPLPFEVSDVSIVTAEEFAALTAEPAVPDLAPQPLAPSPPGAATDTPDVAAPAEAPPDRTRPDPAPEPVAEDTPAPAADLSGPEAPPEDAPPLPPVLEEPDREVAVLTPSPLARPRSRPADRVAPQPVAPPPPDARPDEVASPAVVPDETGETERPEQQQTAPEAATDRIVTEAEKGREVAPAQSLRPRARPARPVAVAKEKERPAPKPPADTRKAVNAALAEALGGAAPSPAAPLGPPLTAGEREALRLAVSQCWNVGSLSSQALRTTVVVSVSMKRDGKPEIGSIRMLSSQGGTAAAARQAFEAARRAIIRCGASGYRLPLEKYDQWRDIEITFNPERMRIK